MSAMARLKRYLSGYRPPSSTLQRDSHSEFYTKQAEAYLAWLCKARGWFSADKECPDCHGVKLVYPSDDSKTRSQWSYWRSKRRKAGLPAWLTEADKIECPRCDGTGRVPNDGECLDTARAQAHIDAQQYELEAKAQAAVEGLCDRLRAYGYGAKLLWHDQNGQPVHSGSLFTNGERVIFVAVRKVNKRAHDIEPDAQIIIKPGMSPSGLELDVLVAHAVMPDGNPDLLDIGVAA